MEISIVASPSALDDKKNINQNHINKKIIIMIIIMIIILIIIFKRIFIKPWAFHVLKIFAALQFCSWRNLCSCILSLSSKFMHPYFASWRQTFLLNIMCSAAFFMPVLFGILLFSGAKIVTAWKGFTKTHTLQGLADKLRMIWLSMAGFVFPSVYIRFRLFAISKYRSGQLSTKPSGAYRFVGF